MRSQEGDPFPCCDSLPVILTTHGGHSQEYDYHLAAVNTITFVDEGRRFMTTSDDKTIRFWEMGINVQVRRFPAWSGCGL